MKTAAAVAVRKSQVRFRSDDPFLFAYRFCRRHGRLDGPAAGNHWFARLAAGGSWIRTSGSRSDYPAALRGCHGPCVTAEPWRVTPGLTGSPDESGARRREQGLARAGDARVRRGMVFGGSG